MTIRPTELTNLAVVLGGFRYKGHKIAQIWQGVCWTLFNTLFSPKNNNTNVVLAKFYYCLLYAMPIGILKDMEAASKAHIWNANLLVCYIWIVCFFAISSRVAYLVLSSTICHFLISSLFQSLVNALFRDIISLLRLVIAGETWKERCNSPALSKQVYALKY